MNLGRNLPAGSGYRVTIHTCDVADAGTDARIQLQLTGDGGTGPLVELKTASSDPFERGIFDTHFFSAADLGHLRSARIVSNMKGDKPGWCLDYLNVTRYQDGQEVEWFDWLLAQSWLDKNAADRTFGR